jgi:hypothetical protein
LWERTLGSYLFCQVLKTEAILITTTKSANIFRCPSTINQTLQPSTQAFPTKGNFSKNVKKKKHNANKREVLQAHAAQIQTLQNVLESLKAQLANLKGKSSQLASPAQLVHGSGSWEGPPSLFYGLSHNAMVGSMLFLLHTILDSH